MNERANIRNSTAEFLIFTGQSGENSIEVRVAEESVWLTQKLMGILFEVSVPTINEHLSNLFNQNEISKSATIRDFRIVQKEGTREVARNIEFYNLEAIIAVGFRVNSLRAIQFRQWAISILKDFAIRGYVLDKERLKNGSFFNKAYFDGLLEEIREIRASERRFYQKITDIYATAMDYDPKAEITQRFFADVQNKLHFAIHGHTAAELLVERADSKKERMGLTTWKNAPDGKILKPDVIIAKNYLTEVELKSLDRFIAMYLDYAEDRASRNIPMTMKDWTEKLNAFLQFNERDILNNPGKVSKEVAKAFAESEFEKYRIVQDRLFESDFDKHIKHALENHERLIEKENHELSPIPNPPPPRKNPPPAMPNSPFSKHQITPFSNLVSLYDAFLLDAYGVFWGSSETGVLAGASEMMKTLVDQGKFVGILSNSSQLAAKEMDKFSKHKIHQGIHYHFLLTSGEITQNLLRSEKLPFPTPSKTYWLFGPPHPRFASPTSLFEGSAYVQTDDLCKADFIYIGIPHINGLDQENPEVFRSAVQHAAARQIPVLCANPDRFAQEGKPPRSVVRQGSLASLFTECGASVHLIGKPSVLAYEFALSKFPGWVKKERVLMLGDTPETDIRGARSSGLDAALITETGIMAERMRIHGTEILSQLPETDRPRFFTTRFSLYEL